MASVFLIQIISSFIIGGVIIALLSFVAEKVSSRNAGIILSLPSTVAISLFFIGLTKGAESIRDAAVVIPFSLGASVFFVAVYVNIAQAFKNKVLSIGVSMLAALSVWLLISLPLAVFGFENLPLSIGGYLTLVFLAHLMLYFKKTTPSAIVKYSFNEKLFRAIFAGFVIALVVFLSKTLGLLWGGIFSVFPAAYLSSLIIFHRAKESGFLFNMAKTIPLGSPIFLIYILAANYFFPSAGIWLGTVISYLVSLLAVLLYVKTSKF